MYGNYQHIPFQKNWHIKDADWYLLGKIDGIVLAICEVPVLPDYRRMLLHVSLKKGAQATTAIEGNTLTDEEVEKVAQGESLPKSKRYQEVEVRNVLDAMNELVMEVAVQARDTAITPELIKRFHKLIGKDLGEHLDAIPGRFRQDSRVVANYRCPDYRDVPELIDQLCVWLRRDFQYISGKQPLYDAIIQAIVTHVYLEWIHPFGDGNGRTGRLLEFYILLRVGMPDIASHILSNHYNDTRNEYYRQIANAHQNRDLSEFIHYALQGLHDGLEQTLDKVQKAQFKVAWTSYIHEAFSRQKISKRPVLQRRRNLILGMETDKAYTLDELPLLNTQVAKDYATYSDKTLKRDIEFLERDCNLVKKVGDKFLANAEILLNTVARRRHIDEITN